ncbi:response regulator [Bremerella cremea]|uniref:Pilus assembly protein CpaE n=1 Tax=Blastopirellula marina TaxID=124 RepID=A0A2S8FEB9_9BACT|nr:MULTISPECIES: response regulator [Pirellulaceae]PQO30487.1 pilus assembly protein CpaE [Blastopirellula marina]RCS43840.1 response regulator [Bremerella cremea]
MSNVLRVALVDPKDSSRETLKSTLLGMDIVWLEAECSRYEFFADVVGQTNPDIGIVAIDSDPDKAVRLIQEVHESTPDCSILVVSGSSDGQLILRAMRAGAKEFLTQPLSLEDLVSALERIGHQRFGKGNTKSRSCKVITVCGATGGVGATSLAVNLGCILASREENNVALIDLDLALGDSDVFLDTIPDYTLLDVAQNIKRLDFNLLKRSLTRHSSGLYLLPRPVQLQDEAPITPDDLTRVIGLMKATFTHLIIDTSKSYSSLDMVAMKEAQINLMTIQLDLPCLRNVVRLMMSFGEVDGLKEKTKVIVNRVGLDNGEISLKKAQETIGSEIYWQIPNEYRVMVEVRNNGVPLIEQAPRAGITQALVGLAESLSGDGSKKANAGKSGLGRWFGFLSSKNEKAAKSEESEASATE